MMTALFESRHRMDMMTWPLRVSQQLMTNQELYAHVDSGDGTVRLSPSTSHTLLQPIGTGARQHFVDSDDVEGVHSDSHVEGLLSGGLHDVLVGANSGSLESLGRELLVLVGDEVAAEGEVIDGSLLSSEIVDSDLGVRDTTVVSGLGEPAGQSSSTRPQSRSEVLTKRRGSVKCHLCKLTACSCSIGSSERDVDPF